MISALILLSYLFITSFFGYCILKKLLKISSFVLLIPLSVTLGTGSFIFLLQSLSFLLTPRLAAPSILIIQFATSVLMYFIKINEAKSNEADVSKNQLVILIASTLMICFSTYLGIFRYGTFDRTAHLPMATSIFQNNTYPPMDPYRPDYVLLYHYGGDLLAGAINYLSGANISTSYELISSLFSGITFLSFISLGWILSKNFYLSFIAGFCAYFSGGLLWFDAILRYLIKNFPGGETNWSFLQTFLNLGIHGSIINPPSVITFTSTSSLGNPMLIFCLIIFYLMTLKIKFKETVPFIIVLFITLFSLYMTTDWLYVTFWAGAVLFSLFILSRKNKQALAATIILLVFSAISYKTLANPLFMQDAIQNLGRTNIFALGIKKDLFTVVSWGRLATHIMNYTTINCFSWDFLCEFGLSLILIPFAIIYLVREKNVFSMLLFFCIITTMPLPAIIDFKLNPVELVRLFAFGNTMLVLLITFGINFALKTFFQSKILTILYLIFFCLSPISQLTTAIIFTPHAFTNKEYVRRLCISLRATKSLFDLKIVFKSINDMALSKKDSVFWSYKNEMDFLKKHCKERDVVISSLYEVPAFVGIYSVIPPGKLIYWDQLYSSFSKVFNTAFNTLDPYLISELNIKWILIDNNFKQLLPKEALETLQKQDILKLAYSKQNIEIYRIEDLTNLMNTTQRKTAWLLINNIGQTIETSVLNQNRISLFPTKISSLIYLNNLYSTYPDLKKQLITAQPVPIEQIENQIKSANLAIALDRKF